MLNYNYQLGGFLPAAILLKNNRRAGKRQSPGKDAWGNGAQWLDISVQAVGGGSR
jgi:hypothetical protein